MTTATFKDVFTLRVLWKSVSEQNRYLRALIYQAANCPGSMDYREAIKEAGSKLDNPTSRLYRYEDTMPQIEEALIEINKRLHVLAYNGIEHWDKKLINTFVQECNELAQTALQKAGAL